MSDSASVTLKASLRKGRSVGRVSLDLELERHWPRLPPTGLILDLGSKHGPYRAFFPSEASVLSMDIDAASEPDIVSDIHAIDSDSDRFDGVVATEVLEHVRDPRTAVAELRRILKPGGICILSTRFVQYYHPDPCDYYRFTKDSLGDLFSGFSQVDIHPHGDEWLTVWAILTRSWLGKKLHLYRLNERVGRRRVADTRWPMGFVVVATK
jgi:SAM-dependent methyltransferase